MCSERVLTPGHATGLAAERGGDAGKVGQEGQVMMDLRREGWAAGWRR